MDSTERRTPELFFYIFLAFLHHMKKHKKKTGPQNSAAKQNSLPPVESRASESLTVLWAVTVLMVLVADVLAVAAHFYLTANPEAEKVVLLKGLLLFTGSLVGAVSLIVLPILYRVRQVPPPPGLAVFGACVAAAPILTQLVGAAQ